MSPEQFEDARRAVPVTEHEVIYDSHPVHGKWGWSCGTCQAKRLGLPSEDAAREDHWRFWNLAPTPNVLRVSRPAGSGRPNKGRKLISVWIAQSSIDNLDQLASEFGVSRSDLIRDALKAGLPVIERQLKRGKRDT